MAKAKPEWISVKQAAEEGGYSTKQILRLIHAKELDAEKFVTVWRVDRRSLLAYLEKAKKRGAKRGPKTGA